jgi:hypothetical protein
MKIKLTEYCSKELERINNMIDDDFDYEEMSDLDILIADAGMYANDAYIENNFDDLNEWCIKVSPEEYEQSYLDSHPNVVLNKVNRMLELDLIEII